MVIIESGVCKEMTATCQWDNRKVTQTFLHRVSEFYDPVWKSELFYVNYLLSEEVAC